MMRKAPNRPPGPRPWSRDAYDRTITAVLSVLVALSVVLSGLLWTGTPAPVNIGRTGFFSGPQQVSDKTVEGLFRPIAIWIWTQNNELFRLSGGASGAAPILQALHRGRLQDRRWLRGRSAAAALPPAGASLRLDFGTNSLPVSLLSWIVPGLTDGRSRTVVNGPVYVAPTAGKGVYVISYQSGPLVFRGTVTSSSSALAAAFTPTNQAIPYVQIPSNGRVFNLPYDALTMQSEMWLLSSTAPSHIIDSFFSDPTAVASVQQGAREGTLYTDGSVGVHASQGPFGLVVHYTQASAPLSGWHSSARESLSAAVPFVNDHGGFLGDQIAVVHHPAAYPERTVLTFRTLIGGWPLLGTLNQIRVVAENGVVVSQQRALAQLNMSIGSQQVTILSGPQLIARLGAARLNRVQSISLCYGSLALGSGIVRLLPVYCLVMTGGQVQYLDAVNAKPFQGTGMTNWTFGE